MHRRTRRLAAATGAVLFATSAAVAASAATSRDTILFSMRRSAASIAAGCLPNGNASVRITNEGPVETMKVFAHGLPKNTDFDLFVTQVPSAPFGVSWYQSDMHSNSAGDATVEVIGRFNVETFTVAPGTAAAPQTHPADATTNPAFAPIHTYHLGLWFNKPSDAVKAGCLGATTSFNGDHNAGVQALSTRNFPDGAGPLKQLVP